MRSWSILTIFLLAWKSVAVFSVEPELSFSPSTSFRHTPESRRRLNCNTDLINSAILLALPSMNRLVQSYTPDPLEVNESFEITSSEGGNSCTGNFIRIISRIQNIIGLRTVEVTKMEVKEGTEQVCCGCPTTFSGTFDFDARTERITANGDVFVLDTEFPGADTCAPEELDVVVSISQLSIKGIATLSGFINNNQVVVTSVEINQLTTSCGDVSVSVADTTNFGNLVPAIQASFEDKTCDVIGNFVNSLLIDAFSSGIGELALDWGYVNSGYYIARFMAANAPNIVRTFISGELAETMEKRQEILDAP